MTPKEKAKDYNLRRLYGITLDQYNEILKSQGGVCKICNKHPSQEKRAFHVDHDHRTREIYGIICSYCNQRVVGKNRNPELFYAAAKYLEKGLGIFVPVKKRKRKKTTKSIKKKTKGITNCLKKNKKKKQT